MLCLARNASIWSLYGVSQLRKDTGTHTWLQSDERDGYPPRGSAGAGRPNHASISSSSPLGTRGGVCVYVSVYMCECEWERGRQAAKQPPPQPKDVLLLFFQTLPEGTIFLAIATFCVFSPLALSPFLLSRSDCWRPEYICFAAAASTSPISQEQMLCLGSKKKEKKKTEGGWEGGRERDGRECCRAGGQGWELLLWSGSDRRFEMTQAWTAQVCIPVQYVCAYLSALALICVSWNSNSPGCERHGLPWVRQ